MVNWVIHTNFLAENNLWDPKGVTNKVSLSIIPLVCMGAVLDIQCRKGKLEESLAVSWNGQGGPEFVGQSSRKALH